MPALLRKKGMSTPVSFCLIYREYLWLLVLTGE